MCSVTSRRETTMRSSPDRRRTSLRDCYPPPPARATPSRNRAVRVAPPPFSFAGWHHHSSRSGTTGSHHRPVRGNTTGYCVWCWQGDCWLPPRGATRMPHGSAWASSRWTRCQPRVRVLQRRFEAAELDAHPRPLGQISSYARAARPNLRFCSFCTRPSRAPLTAGTPPAVAGAVQ